MTPVMWISALMYAALAYISLRLMAYDKYKGDALALLTVGFHGVIYYFAITFLTISDAFWNTWSSSLRLHSIFMVAAVAFLWWRRAEREKNG
jgi:hypothetical protein